MNPCKDCGICCTIGNPDERNPVKYIKRKFLGKFRWVCEHYDVRKRECSIYEDRPRMCREFEYDGVMCGSARKVLFGKI